MARGGSSDNDKDLGTGGNRDIDMWEYDEESEKSRLGKCYELALQGEWCILRILVKGNLSFRCNKLGIEAPWDDLNMLQRCLRRIAWNQCWAHNMQDGSQPRFTDAARPQWLGGAFAFLTYNDSERLRDDREVRQKVEHNQEMCSKYILVSQCYFPLVRMALAADTPGMEGNLAFKYKRSGMITEVAIASDQSDQPTEVVDTRPDLNESIPTLSPEKYQIDKFIDKVPLVTDIALKGTAKHMPSLRRAIPPPNHIYFRKLMKALGESIEVIDSMFIGSQPIRLEAHELKGCFLEDKEMVEYLSLPESVQQLDLSMWTSVFERVIKENPDFLEERAVLDDPRGKRCIYCKYCNCMATWQHFATVHCKTLRSDALHFSTDQCKYLRGQPTSPLLKVILAAIACGRDAQPDTELTRPNTGAQPDTELTMPNTDAQPYAALTRPNILDDRSNVGESGALNGQYYRAAGTAAHVVPVQVVHHPIEFQEQQQNGYYTAGYERWSQHLSGFRSNVIPQHCFHHVTFALLLQLNTELASYLDTAIANSATHGAGVFFGSFKSEVLPYEVTSSLQLLQITKLHKDITEYVYVHLSNW